MRVWISSVAFVGAAALGWCLRGPRTVAEQLTARRMAAGQAGSPGTMPATRFDDGVLAQAPTPRDEPNAPVQLTPGAPGYDGVLAGLWLDLTAVETFEREPVDDEWARDLRPELSDLVSTHLAAISARAKVAGVECRTSSCRISIDVPDDEQPAVLEYMQLFVPIGTRVSYELLDVGDGQSAIIFTSVFGNEIRPRAAYREFVANWKEKQHTVIERWKAERRLP
jgi:hypothetical protein